MADVAALLSQLSRAPNLVGAKRRHHEALWDGLSPAAIQIATAVCRNECPCLTACRNHLRASLFPISGVVAGEVIRATKPRVGDGAAGWIDETAARHRRHQKTDDHADHRGHQNSDNHDHHRDDDTRRATAARWLTRQLAAGPRLSNELIAAAAEAGFDRWTLHRGGALLGVDTTRRHGRHTIWMLPQRISRADDKPAIAK